MHACTHAGEPKGALVRAPVPSHCASTDRIEGRCFCARSHRLRRLPVARVVHMQYVLVHTGGSHAAATGACATQEGAGDESGRLRTPHAGPRRRSASEVERRALTCARTRLSTLHDGIREGGRKEGGRLDLMRRPVKGFEQRRSHHSRVPVRYSTFTPSTSTEPAISKR